MTTPESPGSLTPQPPTVLSYRRPGTRQVRRPFPPIFSLAAIGVALFFATVLIGYPIARQSGHGWEAGAFVEVPTGRLNEYNRPAVFHIAAHGTGRGDKAVMDGAYVLYTGIARPGQMNIDLRAMTYRMNLYRNEQPHIPATPLSRAAVLSFIEAADFDPASAEGAALADRLLDELRRLSDGRLPPDVTDQPYAGQTPALRRVMSGTHLVNLGEFGHLLWIPWYTPLCIPVWLLAWWAAGRPLIRRYRRRRSAFEAQPAAIGAGTAALRE